MRPLLLPLNCSNCANFDGESFCALPWRQLLIQASIHHPALVVCAKHEPKDEAEK